MPVKFFRNVRLGVKNLLLHKLRSSLTMLGVVFGVASVVAMLSVGEGASKEALERIRALGSNNILVNSQVSVEDSGASGQQRVRRSIYGIRYDDEIRIRETIPGVRRTVPAKTIRQEGRLGSRTEELRLVGTTGDWFDLVRRTMVVGRPLTPLDIENRNEVVVLTETGARKLLATENTVGQTVRVGGHYFRVVGIIRSAAGSAGSGLPTPDQDVDAYVPLSVARERYGDITTDRASFRQEQVELHQLIIEVADQDQVPAVARSVGRMFADFHPRADYNMIVPLDLLREAERTKQTFNVVLGSIAGISLLVGGIGIMNIMLASVTERTREIGIRRAIGAKRRQIIVQFLIETVVLSTIGGLIGVAVGVAIPTVIEYYADMPTVVTPWSLVLSVGISMLVGIVFGLYPAVRAANLDPIVALRHE